MSDLLAFFFLIFKTSTKIVKTQKWISKNVTYLYISVKLLSFIFSLSISPWSLQTHPPSPKDMCIITISFEQEKVQVIEIINAGTRIHQCLMMNYKSTKQTAGARHDRLTLVKLFFPIYHCGMFDLGVSFWGHIFFPFRAFPDTNLFGTTLVQTDQLIV